MDYSKLSKKMIDYQKTTFSNWYDAVVIMQDQTTSAMKQTLQENAWLLPEEGHKTIQCWIDAFLQERGHIKAYVNEGFAYLEKYFSEGSNAAQGSAKKQATAGNKATQSSTIKRAPSGKKAAKSSAKKQASTRSKAAQSSVKKQAPTPKKQKVV